ncbi:MAG: Sucrose phosphorylase [Candidatus Heimdallarchaeota archaeon LC_3]|nr:MAG: Sucrose phosphorylase [Candidatus Heimdallarchaeota archaeon LC_3]
MTIISEEISLEIMKKLKFLYGDGAEETYKELGILLNKFGEVVNDGIRNERDNINNYEKFTRKDVILNCYADSIKGEGINPLEDIKYFFSNFLKNLIRGLHILPFYEWDTDRGFSVLNYYEIDSRNGTWEQFSSLNETFEILMVDCVLNHASIDNPIVQKSLTGHSDYKDFVINYEYAKKPSEQDLMKITRARPSPVLTQYYLVNDGKRLKATFNRPQMGGFSKTGWVWTTFSRPNNEDGTVATRQVDLNFNNPKLLLEIVNIIFSYISKGASWIRLDAIGYLWKKIGTNCLHLPETHVVIELLAEIFSMVTTKNIVLISEVNEPQEQALQYLGPKSVKKSDLIYLFTHYPLAVHAILTGTAKYYSKWLPSLKEANGRLFISVLGTHDGMGMKPIGKWLPEDEKEKLQKILVEKHGALPNYSKLPGGKQIIYELCSTPWNFINPENSELPSEVQIDRYLAIFGLGLMLKGVPSIYINGLLGIPNYKGKLDENRSINRQILNKQEIISSLTDKKTKMHQIFEKMKKLINIRQREECFDLKGQFEVLNLNESVVSVLLSSYTQKNKIIALVNTSSLPKKVKVDNSLLNSGELIIKDLVSGKEYEKLKTDNSIEITLNPYQICWLQ